MEYERPPDLQDGVETMSKVCSKCGEEKPLEEFHRTKRSPDGRYSSCKECYRADYETNRETKLASVRAYRNANKDKIRAYAQQYQATNAERIAAQRQIYRAAHRDEINQQAAAYREEHREELRRKQREYRKTEQGARKKAEWNAAHPESVLANQRRQTRKRRARLQQSYARLTAQEESETKSHGCFFCGSRKCLTMAHDIPVGPSGPAIRANIFCLCQPCNTRMGRRNLAEVLEQRTFLEVASVSV